ncbi:hemolysin III family protein [Bordetella sp. BOR01]|uniref:PAQR family membrane homeostasis protein TrhA n=1 Tax=Bordetella sp. BOR01 TaxID=2854779 RepID=UPI001C43871F|nr:hemolysin III family protein [Bordetella sp. BOR01]MBV7486608.1 hemolysin III family protein [Bordetella sp. BOR01]
MYYGERFNSTSHLAGLVLALASASLLIPHVVARSDDGWHIVSCAIFTVAVVCVYATSVAYHCARGPGKAVWEKLDHCMIYLLIAATYTSLGLIPLRQEWGWPLTAAAWTLALAGIAREIVGWRRPTRPAVPLYVAMGWLGLAAAVPIADSLAPASLAWLVAGALCYSVGLVFYRQTGRWAHAHGIWHLFVLGGTACHVLMVWSFLN